MIPIIQKQITIAANFIQCSSLDSLNLQRETPVGMTPTQYHFQHLASEELQSLEYPACCRCKTKPQLSLGCSDCQAVSVSELKVSQ